MDARHEELSTEMRAAKPIPFDRRDPPAARTGTCVMQAMLVICRDDSGKRQARERNEFLEVIARDRYAKWFGNGLPPLTFWY